MKQFTESHVFTGLRRDLSVSKHPANYLYDAQNIRITARDDDTLLSVTNERGTEDTMISVSGEYVGHCLLNDYLVVFSTIAKSSKDYITRIDLSSEDVGKAKTVLYGDSLSHGSLGFSTDHPIDAIASYESEHIQKVYWTDGKNQPRIINISPSMDNKIGNYNEYSFDFIPVLKLEETVTVKKGVGEGGAFASGVIQYAFTYYRQYGQESNIFYVSPLLYISPKDRGAAPDEKVENVFHIKVGGLDHNFDFLRIYSIHRTSINATPIVKRVQDLSLRGLDEKATLSFTDTGYEGDSIDPTELLYKGGLPITAKTLDQKDGTLFLGNIKMVNEAISVGSELKSIIQTEVDKIHVKGFSLESDSRYCYMEGNPSGGYDYFNQLTAYNHDSSVLEKSSVPCGGFKAGDYYRCGVQFQHESGRWTDPIFLKDYRVEQRSVMKSSNQVKLSVIKGHLTSNICTSLIASGFKKVRAVVVYPEMQDRNVLCQGVTCPTVFTRGKREADKNLYGQSSWFFRPKFTTYGNDDGSGTVSPTGAGAYDTYTSSSTDCIGSIPYCEEDPTNFRQVEIQGSFDKDNNQFRTDGQFLTFHSPDVEFDEGLQLVDFSGTFAKKVGDVKFTNTFSDIDLQTESPTISNNGSGFTHKSFVKTKSYGICAGLFWDDFMVDDNEGFEAFTHEQSPYKWLVYPWHRTGSLNNDVNRPADKGTRTALLRKKIISNLRYAETDWDLISKNTWNSQAGFCNFSKVPKLFSSNEVSIVKWGDALYQGNVDTALSPDNPDSLYFAFEGDSYKDVKTTYFDSPIEWRTYPGEYSDNNKRHSIQKYDNGQWVSNSDAVGNDFQDLVQTKDAVRMKYKSTAHLVFETSFNNYIIPGTGDKSSSLNEESIMALVEIIRGYGYRDTMFGGKTPDALKANVWIPCGEPESLSADSEGTDFWYSYGDSYIQRWDCLKTYPFTPEDPNQIVEIGSFVLESRVNIDGRYDRNRGQLSNINMSPVNFNLLNPVYGQQNNFFTYRIQDDDFYKNVDYPNQVTWTKTKQDGADTDLWTNITLASTYSMDGSKGGVESLNVWKDQIYCFQDRGISNILFNSRVQIPTSDGVPIEISNSYKVDGYRYLSDGIGCSDHRLIQETPSGIYFIDSMNNHLFQITDSLQDLSESHNMTTWFNDGRDSYCRVVYDSLHHDVYVVQGDGGKALCFSEKLNEFTSFMDYADISLMETSSHHVFSMKDSRLFRMFEGKYNDFFGVYSGNDYLPHLYPWSLTFISSGASNQLTAYDKIFTNLEFRAIVEGDGIFTEEADPVTGEGRKKLTEFLLPFDYLETWNEYQHGFTTLENKRGHAAFLHHQDNTSSLKRKFRIWRCDIPRDNTSKSGAGITGVFDATFDYTFGNSGNRRVTVNRMRNPWLFLKLQKNVESGTSGLPKTELHDIQVKYFV